MVGCKCTCRLSAISLGIAFGVFSAICMASFAWWSYWSGRGVPMIAQWGEIYQGYASTIMGGWIGAAWGFLEGFICGVIIAWVYNLCLCCCKSLCRSGETCGVEVEVKKTRKM